MNKIKSHSEDKINVIYIIGKFGIGGIETLIYKIAKNLDRRFFYPTIIALNDYEDRTIESQIILSLKKDGIETLKLSGSIKNNRLRKILFIRKNLERKKNIVIHTNSDIINSILATWKTKIPMINTYHLPIGFGKKDRIVYKLFMKNKFKIVAVSEAVKVGISKNIGIEKSKIEVIYNGIEIEKFNSNSNVNLTNNNNVTKLLSIGRLDKQKGFIFALEALKYVNLKNIEYDIAGDGPLKKELEQFVFNNDLEKQVHFLGSISNDNVPHLLWTADVFIMPSLYEGFGISLIEAMAAGKPLILSSIDPFYEVLGYYDALQFSNGFAITKFGIIFEVGNYQALSNAINWMIENREKWPEFSKNSYERAKDFDISKTVLKYQMIYTKSLLKNE